MLIGEDDISNDVITLALVFKCLCTFTTFVGNLTAQLTGQASRELEVEIFTFQRCSCKLSFLFPPCR